ncbi:putative toxin-antitoxin system toxin component, PIN family [Paenibacillus jiagnxiensis]|uniref:putative toxin-antitoxin system toxin component, PIN family n=1 Tax=Paenibacillus jiagnxiensis TaxID=3228926 RepID=UPI0033A1D29E
MDLVVVDTNVFVNAIFSDYFKDDERIIDLEENEQIRFAFSEITKNELYKIFARTIDQQNVFECAVFFETLYNIIERSVYISNPPKLERISSDKGDQPFIELAVAARASYLITNDFSNGLLKLRTYNNVEILTPTSYIKKYIRENRKAK